MTEQEMRKESYASALAYSLKYMREGDFAEARYWLSGALVYLQAMENTAREEAQHGTAA